MPDHVHVPTARSLPRRPRLLVVDDDPDLRSWLEVEAGEAGIQLTTVASASEALEELRRRLPHCLFVDVHLGEESGSELVQAARRLPGAEHLPIVSISTSQAVPDRLACLHAGADAYLTKPIRLGHLLEAADRLTEQPPHGRHSVLLLGTRGEALTPLGDTLLAANIDLVRIDQPAELFTQLADLQPDLAILSDTSISALDACRLVRSDAQLDDLPIVAICGGASRCTSTAMLRAGADDYLTQPVVPEEVTARILGRLQRHALIRALSSRDPLTGLFNRRYLDRCLRAEVHLCERTAQPLSMAMLDIDHFKQVNDRLGHPAGDAVLRELSAELRASFRRNDLCARYGGEEFLVLMRDVDARTCRGLVDRFRARFAAHRFAFAPELRVTLSAGIAAMPEHARDAETLLAEADAALYASKRAGRDVATISQTIPRDLLAGLRRGT